MKDMELKVYLMLKERMMNHQIFMKSILENFNMESNENFSFQLMKM